MDHFFRLSYESKEIMFGNLQLKSDGSSTPKLKEVDRGEDCVANMKGQLTMLGNSSM